MRFTPPIRRARSVSFDQLEPRVLLSRPVGLDAAGYQGNVNWTQVKSAGYVFAWEKATQGNYYRNPYFGGNITNAKNAGVLIGAYDFGDFSVDPTTEANYFWSDVNTTYDTIKADGKTLSPMLDVEATNTIPAGWGATQISNWVTTWCDRIVSLANSAGLSLKPVLYTYVWFSNTYLNSTVTSYPLWMASNYVGQNPQTGSPASTAPWSNWAFWQYGQAVVPGITASDDADIDVFNGTMAGLQTHLVTALAPPPTATLATQSPATGTSFFQFTVTYSDATVSVDASTLNSSDITVTGPGGYSQNALLVSKSPTSDASSITATYQISAPNSAWNTLANGIYTVKINSSQVSNTQGAFIPTGPVGTFTVNEPFAYVYNDRLLINSTATKSSISLNDSGGSLQATNGANTFSFDPSTFSSIAFIGTAGNDALAINTTLPSPLLYAGGGGADVLNVNAGVMNFSSDAGSIAPNLTLTLANNAQANFSASQHLGALNLRNNATATLAAGAAITLETQSLTMADSARLDLADNALVVDGGTNVDTIQGYLASGFANGKWNGVGIDSSAATGGYSVGYNLAGNLSYSSINGVSFSQSAIVVRPALNGDANLDGQVNADDYALILQAQSQQQSAPGTVSYWYNGDFTFDKKITADDWMMMLLGTSVGQQILNA